VGQASQEIAVSAPNFTSPKPLVGEREFSLAPIIRSYEFGHSRDAVFDRLDRLSTGLNLDRERARRWCLVQTLA
jgi:hypothetical protein